MRAKAAEWVLITRLDEEDCYTFSVSVPPLTERSFDIFWKTELLISRSIPLPKAGRG